MSIFDALTYLSKTHMLLGYSSGVPEGSVEKSLGFWIFWLKKAYENANILHQRVKNAKSDSIITAVEWVGIISMTFFDLNRDYKMGKDIIDHQFAFYGQPEACKNAIFAEFGWFLGYLIKSQIIHTWGQVKWTFLQHRHIIYRWKEFLKLISTMVIEAGNYAMRFVDYVP